MAGKPIPIEPRFSAQFDQLGPEDCWLWKGARYPVGYGKICVLGKSRGAHRVALWLAGKFDLESPLYVLHSCDNRLCVNPAHLRPGTQKENIGDACRRGRMIFQTDPSRIVRGDDHPARRNPDLRRRMSERQAGEQSHRAKLTEADVRKIFDMRAQRMTQDEIASSFSISREQVGNILRRKAWGHLTGLPSIPSRRTCGAWKD